MAVKKKTPKAKAPTAAKKKTRAKSKKVTKARGGGGPMAGLFKRVDALESASKSHGTTLATHTKTLKNHDQAIRTVAKFVEGLDEVTASLAATVRGLGGKGGYVPGQEFRPVKVG